MRRCPSSASASTAIGMSQPAVARYASVCGSSIASGETGQNRTLNGWSSRTRSREPKTVSRIRSSHSASRGLAISSWMCLENSELTSAPVAGGAGGVGPLLAGSDHLPVRAHLVHRVDELGGVRPVLVRGGAPLARHGIVEHRGLAVGHERALASVHPELEALAPAAQRELRGRRGQRRLHERAREADAAIRMVHLGASSLEDRASPLRSRRACPCARGPPGSSRGSR